MGIINLTPDSFSDGGSCLEVNEAVEKANLYINNGADVLDLGAQSTRPGAIEIGSDKEIERLLPSLIAIRKNFPNILISVDTFLSKVADIALHNGADWINDISGGTRDQNIINIVAQNSSPYIVTHSRGNSRNMNKLIDYENVVKEVYDELLFRTNNAIDRGVLPENIIWDPGIGFAKTTEQNLELLRNLEYFKSAKFPVLVGPSRKRFIGDILKEIKPDQRDFGTAAVVCKCCQAKVDMVRVHDVKSAFQVIRLSSYLWD